MPWVRLRTVIEDAAAQEAADSFNMEFQRFDEAWEGLKWILARDPGIGFHKAEKPGYWLYGQASDELAKTPEIWVVYTFDKNDVVIYDVLAKTPPEEDEPDEE